MALGLYKSGEGYWTRVLTAVGISLLVLGAIFWFGRHFVPELIEPSLRGAVDPNALSKEAYAARMTEIEGQMKQLTRWVQIAMPIVTALGLWFLLNRPRFVDFLIATESEMRKVEWPTMKSVAISTGVVLLGIALVGAFLFGVDQGFLFAFKYIGIL